MRPMQPTIIKVDARMALEFTGDECFLVFDGRRIAAREDGAWRSFEPRFTVSGDYDQIVVEYGGCLVH
jgi:hypothetical protein